jgi:uncharacterized protein (TIGR00255 family)
MTGFGKGEKGGENFTVTTEIKSVNNRFRDFKFRMSHVFNPLEIEIRSRLEAEFKRGSFDINITYKKNEKSGTEFQVNEEKVSAYLKLMKSISEKSGVDLKFSPTEFLRSDFFKDEDDNRESEMAPLLFDSLAEAIKALKLSREQEGAKLASKLLEHLEVYVKNLSEVEQFKNRYPEKLKEKLVQKLEEKLKDLKLDEGRALQEVLYYLERLEVEEELNRAKIHVEKLREVLQSSGEIGRQIDFLLQELGRETNTLGSKSAQADISSNVVEMKVQLEKIREQALNLE